MICTETVAPLDIAMEPETTRFPESRGYAIRGMSFPNTIYLDMALLAKKVSGTDTVATRDFGS